MICFDSGQPFDFDAFLDRFVRFESARWHVCSITPVDDERLVRAQPLGCARRVHRRVAATVDDDPASETRSLAELERRAKAKRHRALARHPARGYRRACRYSRRWR